MNKPAAITTIAILVFACGCTMFSETRSEKKVPAEYNLTETGEQKIAVIIENPIWADAPRILTGQLTDEIHKKLKNDLKLAPKKIISQEKISEYMRNTPQAEMQGPIEIGRSVGADLVLYAQIQNFKLTQTAETDYYRGLLDGKAALFDAETGEKLWPLDESGKTILVSYEIEQGNYEAAVGRLARAFAHCTTRYLYNCPVPRYKIYEDKSGMGWKDWE